MIFYKASPSSDLERFLKSWLLHIDPQLGQLRKRYPQENWSKLYSATYEACKLAAKGNDAWMVAPPIPKPVAETGTPTPSTPSGGRQ